MNNDWRQPPGFPNYMVNAEGDILKTSTEAAPRLMFDKNNQSLIRPSDVSLARQHSRYVPVGLLVALCFLDKPADTTEISYVLDHRDGDASNCKASNLYWKPTHNTLIPENLRSEFKVIPLDLLHEHRINKEGVLISSRFWRKKPWRVDKDGYKIYNIDLKRSGARHCRTIGLHRLLALAFLDCPGNPKNYQVNHKDGNKLNNDLDNLEWVSSAENVRHAYETGLCSSNMFVITKHATDQSLTKLKSLKDAARYLGSNPDRVGNAVNTKQVVRDHFVAEVDRETQSVVWSDGTTTDATTLPLKIFTNTILSRNIVTDKIEIWDNSNQVTKALGIDHSVVESRASMQTPWPVRNYCFLWGDAYKNGSRFRDFTPEEILCFKDQTGIKNPVKVTDDLGNVRIFRSADYVAKALASTAALVGKAIHGKTKIDGCVICYLQ